MKQGPHPIGCPCDYCFTVPDPMVEVERIKRRVHESLYWVEQESCTVEVLIRFRMPVKVDHVMIDFTVADDSTPD